MGPQEKAIKEPMSVEMAEACEILKIPHVLECKHYPRDWFPRLGRIKVLLQTPEGAWTHPDIHTKDELMLKIAEIIPSLKSRTAPGSQQQRVELAAPVRRQRKKQKERR